MIDQKKPSGNPAAVNGLGTGLTVAGSQDITYKSALETAKKSREYQTLMGVIDDPYIIGDNYQWLIDFLKNRATKFWRYLKIREAGKVDNDLIRAANILEYSRLIAKLVNSYPEFSEKILPHVSQQFPEDFPPGQVITPGELVQKLEKLNQKDYVDPKPEKPAAPAESKTPVSTPAPDPASTAPVEKKTAGPRLKSPQIIEEVLAGIDEEVNKNQPQYSGFSLEAKCAILGLSEWTKIIGSVSDRHPEFAGSSILQIVEVLCANNQDPRIEKICAYLKQMLN